MVVHALMTACRQENAPFHTGVVPRIPLRSRSRAHADGRSAQSQMEGRVAGGALCSEMEASRFYCGFGAQKTGRRPNAGRGARRHGPAVSGCSCGVRTLIDSI